MSERPFDCITLIGAGTLGAQIAMVAAKSGYKVRIFDTNEGAFEETLKDQKADLERKGKTPFVPWDQWDACMKSVLQTTGLEEAVQGAGLIIEAIPENLDLKKTIFSELGRLSSPETILATNSSSIPISHIEESTGRAERCLNLHFYRPIEGMNIVDCMGGTKTLDEVKETGVAFIRSLGFIPLTVNKELLGFCFNRVWRAVKRETLHMWAGGFVDFRDVDRGWMVFTGMNVGPFGFMDAVGLDVVYDIEMVYYNESKDPKDYPPQAFKEMIDRGELGIKTGKGFYTYPDPEFLRPEFLK